MSEPKMNSSDHSGKEVYPASALARHKENYAVILVAAVIFLIAIVVPVYWQYSQHPEWGLLGVWRHEFSGAIDWSAWWAFGTFTVALLAAIIAYRELASNRNEQWERNRALIQMSYSILGGLIYIEISNVGKTTAKDIRIAINEEKKDLREDVQKLAKGIKAKRLLHGKWDDVDISDEIEAKIIDGVFYRKEPFVSLAPGTNLTFLFGAYKNAATDEVGEKLYQLSGTVEYLDHNNRKCPPEEFTFDFRDMQDAIWPTDNPPSSMRGNKQD